MSKIFDDSGINWNKPNCIKCFSEMNYKEFKGKKIRYFDKKNGWCMKKYLSRYVCPECGYSVTVETERDIEVREGYFDKECGVLAINDE